MSTGYCHNCGWRGDLADGVFCLYCLTWFYKHGKLPAPPRQTGPGYVPGCIV